jgi:uncharacterized membrane protein
MNKIRKALVAGAGAGLTALVGGITGYADGGITGDEWSKIAATTLLAIAVVGWSTWRVRNTA